MTTRIYIRPERLPAPAIALSVKGKPTVPFVSGCTIHGPSRLVQDPEGLDGRTDIQVWVETDAVVEADG